MNELIIENIHSGYDSKLIVKGVSFKLQEGELCALIGPNGCGKTTLIKTLCGLVPRVQGSCTLNGFSYYESNEKERARLVAYIPQRGSTINGRTCLDVVLMGLNARMGIFEHYSQKQINFAKKTMKNLDIGKYENLLYEQLSEGQKQLVILARTLVQDTKVVFMDEPDSALDITNKNQILAIVKKLVLSEKKIGLISLHDPNAALTFCDRILIMKEGKIIHDLRRENLSDYEYIQKALSDIYSNIRIIDNDGLPVMVSSHKS